LTEFSLFPLSQLSVLFWLAAVASVFTLMPSKSDLVSALVWLPGPLLFANPSQHSAAFHTAGAHALRCHLNHSLQSGFISYWELSTNVWGVLATHLKLR
jgi:hypothetical protein